MATPLDEERARLREAGYTDEEISRYFVERLRGEGQAPATGGGAAPQGNMSGVLGNANAVLGHVRATIPVVTSATANLSNPAAPAKSRLKSAAVLVGIGLIVCVLGFAIWQEWQQHIIAATEIQNSQVRKIQAEADAARALNEAQVKKLQAEADAAKALNDAQVKKLEAEAAVAKQVNEAQATKLKADAAVAGEVAAGAKAKSCSERLDLLAKNMIPDDMDMSGGTMTVKPGTASARMMEKYNRECGGITGATGEASEISEQTKLDLAACIKGEDPDSQIKGCTGLLEARSGDYGKLTRDLIYFARASAYREKHENQKIIDDMNTAIQINPTREVLYNLRGIAYMIVDNDKAIADFTKAIELDPSDWRPYRNRSLVYKTNTDSYPDAHAILYGARDTGADAAAEGTHDV
jgi:tetratricopeptide (TPR) repeat protein